MTLYHFGNCVALIYGPYYMTYKYSGLSEYGAFWKCMQACVIYTFTQLCKMLMLATFFDVDLLNTNGNFSLVAESLRCCIDLTDMLGFGLILSRIPGKGHNKIITAGLGWAMAEVVLTKGVLLWSGARGPEFSWTYLQKCLESNVLLVQHVTTATLVWMFSRHDLDKTIKPVVTVLLLLTAYKGFWLEGLLDLLTLNAWFTLILKTLVSMFIGLASLYYYISLAQQIGL